MLHGVLNSYPAISPWNSSHSWIGKCFSPMEHLGIFFLGRAWFQIVLYSQPYLAKWSNLTSIFWDGCFNPPTRVSFLYYFVVISWGEINLTTNLNHQKSQQFLQRGSEIGNSSRPSHFSRKVWSHRSDKSYGQWGWLYRGRLVNKTANLAPWVEVKWLDKNSQDLDLLIGCQDVIWVIVQDFCWKFTVVIQHLIVWILKKCFESCVVISTLLFSKIHFF